MADKMMRMAGRGEDGTAKAIKTRNDGSLAFEKKPPEYSVIGEGMLSAQGLSPYYDIGLDGTEREVYLLFDIDQAPWTARTHGIDPAPGSNEAYPWSSPASYTFTLFPRRAREDKKSTNPNTPLTSLLLGLPMLQDEMNLGPVDNFSDAKLLAGKYHPKTGVRVENHSSEEMNYKIKVVKYW